MPDLLDAPGEILGGVAAVALLFAVGFRDDTRDLSPPAKAAGMAAAGLVLYVAGISIEVFRVPFWDLVLLSQQWSILLSVVWCGGAWPTL